MDATNKGVGGWRGGLMMPSDTGNQVVCTVGQTDGISNPYNTTRRADIEWNSLGPYATLLMPPGGPTGSVMVLHGLIGSAKSCLQKQTFLSIAIVSLWLDSA